MRFFKTNVEKRTPCSTSNATTFLSYVPCIKIGRFSVRPTSTAPLRSDFIAKNARFNIGKYPNGKSHAWNAEFPCHTVPLTITASAVSAIGATLPLALISLRRTQFFNLPTLTCMQDITLLVPNQQQHEPPFVLSTPDLSAHFGSAYVNGKRLSRRTPEHYQRLDPLAVRWTYFCPSMIIGHQP